MRRPASVAAAAFTVVGVGAIARRLDPPGRHATAEVTGRVRQLTWREFAWLVDRERDETTVLVAGAVRRVRLSATWDMDPWASAGLAWIRVSVVVGGRPTPFWHRGTVDFAGEDLPDERPVPPEPFDLSAFVADLA